MEREQASTLARAAIVGTNPDAPCSAERSIDAKHIVVLAYDHMLDVERGARLLKALAYPLRLSIALHLREGELCVHDLVERVGAAQPLVSQHLTVLKSAGVISGRRQGREIVYRLTDEHISHIVLDALTHASEGGAA